MKCSLVADVGVRGGAEQEQVMEGNMELGLFHAPRLQLLLNWSSKQMIAAIWRERTVWVKGMHAKEKKEIEDTRITSIQKARSPIH